MLSEIPLLHRVAKGEPHAVAECLDRYKNLVWALARRSCPDSQAMEDAVQEIFLKLWTVAYRFDASLASETTFVAMIARRSLIDLSRKKSSVTASPIEFDSFSTAEMGAAERAELNDEAAKAAVLLEQLPADQQSVIRLSVFKGLSHAGIAKQTGLSLGTVKSNLRRGMLRLRSALVGNESDSGSMPTSVAQGEPR